MAKVALLIGVSDYESDLKPLPSAARDVDAMQRVLQNPETGGFDEVVVLKNPMRQDMKYAIYRLFTNRQAEDLLLFYFSGHGIIDESGEFYLATPLTRKDEGILVSISAVAGSDIYRMMENCRSKRQIMIFDSCFSGAFAKGMTAKDAGTVNLQVQLGGEGRAIMTAATSTQYAFQREGLDLSIYTHYLVEGIETGAADLDNDGWISVNELHDFVSRKIHEAAPAMTPEFYPPRAGYKLLMARSPKDSPMLKYRKEVERRANQADFSVPARRMLDSIRIELHIQPDQAAKIESEVLHPYRSYQRNLQEYRQTLLESIQKEYPLGQATLNDLRDYQIYLGLRAEDVESIAEDVLTQLGLVEQTPSPTRAVQAQKPSEPLLVSPVHQTILPAKRPLEDTVFMTTPSRAKIDDAPNLPAVPLPPPRVNPSARETATLANIPISSPEEPSYLQVNLQKLSQVPDDLSSEVGLDYRPLRQLLVGGNWRDADQETYRLILKLVNRQEGDRLRVQDVPSLPCSDLRSINQLWTKYSMDRFGFSIQARIWRHPKINQDWQSFTRQVGWRDSSTNLRKYSDMIFSLKAPQGHLPLGPGVPEAFWMGYGPCLAALVIKLYDCQIR